jgi:transposase
VGRSSWHLADPAETAAKRGRKRRAKTDRADCELLLRRLLARELPESWIPPAQILGCVPVCACARR